MNELLIKSWDLQFFAKEGPGGEKTEEATSKKLGDARQKGQVSKSTDLNIAVLLCSVFLLLKVTISIMGDGFIDVFKYTFSRLSDYAHNPFDANVASTFMSYGIVRIIIISLPIFVVTFVVSVISNLVQVKWKPTLEPMKPSFNKFNPVSGFKRIFSKEKIFELIKTVAKLGILFYVIYDAVKDKWSMVLELYSMNLWSAIGYIGSVALDLGFKVSIVFLAIAFVDAFYQKRKFKKDMRMTKQEVKDEYKMTEGNPEIKSQIKRKMREVSRRRMMQSLPEADVVITNPTHLAVAIKYDREVSTAPVVIAKGADFLAAKIKEVAKDNDIEIVENKPLARMLYANVELGEEIPPELYQMVAEILAYVYGLKGKN